MQVKNFFSVIFIAIILTSSLFTSLGCTNDEGRVTQITNCDELNNNQDACDKAKDANGSQCFYDVDNTCKPRVIRVTDNCADFVNDEPECKKSRDCTWDPNKDPKCFVAEAGKAGKCGAIQDEPHCDLQTDCKWESGDCIEKTGGLAKVNVYTLKKIDNTDFKIPVNKIRGLTASKDGNFVYLIGSEKNQLQVLDAKANNAKWDDALDWQFIQYAKNPSNDKAKMSQKLKDQSVSKFYPTNEGIIFQATKNSGLVVVKGKGGADVSIYEQSDKLADGGNYLGREYSPFWSSKGFIYLLQENIKKIDSNSVIYRQYASPGTKDTYGNNVPSGKTGDYWNTRLVGSGQNVLKTVYSAAAENAAHDIFLGHANGVDKISNQKVGNVADVKIEIDSPPVLVADDLKLDVVDNKGGITAMNVVREFLIVGLKSKSKDTGGIIIKKHSDNSSPVSKFGKGLGISVRSIATNTAGDTAMITTDKGFLIFKDDRLIDVVPGKKLIDAVSIKADQASTAASAPKDGFDAASAGQVWDASKALGGVGFANGLWYIFVKDDGIFTLEIKQEDVK